EAGVALECLSGDAVRSQAPGLALNIAGALYFPTAAQVRPPRFVRALAAGAARLGVQFRTGQPVIDFSRAADRITGVITPAGPISAGTVVVAAGAWSGQVTRSLPQPLPVAPARGQIVLLDTVPPLLPSLVFD